MIEKIKEQRAVKALQAIIIRGRSMAYEKLDHKKIADLLDDAEYLAGLICEEEDRTNAFRSYLAETAVKHQCHWALTEFDQDT
jgi:hypothetical protein